MLAQVYLLERKEEYTQWNKNNINNKYTQIQLQQLLPKLMQIYLLE